MAEAALKAIDAFAKTKSPQEIDLILDKALFSDLKHSVSENPLKYFSKALEIKSDTVNILSAVRISMTDGNLLLFERAFVDGGTFDIDFFNGVFENGIPVFAEKLLQNKQYEKIGKSLSKKTVSLEETEKVSDEIYMNHLKTAKDVQAGAEIVAGFIAAAELEVRNIRITIAGKKLGTSAEKLSERMRESYV